MSEKDEGGHAASTRPKRPTRAGRRRPLRVPVDEVPRRSLAELRSPAEPEAPTDTAASRTQPPHESIAQASGAPGPHLGPSGDGATVRVAGTVRIAAPPSAEATDVALYVDPELLSRPIDELPGEATLPGVRLPEAATPFPAEETSTDIVIEDARPEDFAGIEEAEATEPPDSELVATPDASPPPHSPMHAAAAPLSPLVEQPVRTSPEVPPTAAPPQPPARRAPSSPPPRPPAPPPPPRTSAPRDPAAVRETPPPGLAPVVPSPPPPAPGSAHSPPPGLPAVTPAAASEPRHPPPVPAAALETGRNASAAASSEARIAAPPPPPPPPPVPSAAATPAGAPAAAPSQSTPVATAGEEPSGETGRKARRRPWFEDFFNDDYTRTVRPPTPAQIRRTADFIHESLGLPPGSTLLDVGCGTGLLSVELAARGWLVVGLDLSLPMLSRAADEAQDRGLRINFLHGDMREMSFDGAFDAVLCWGTTFGYFDDETNLKVLGRMYQALKPGGLFLLDVVNRDHVLRHQPNLVWFEGDGCVVMEETQFNPFSSRLEVKRTVILDDGRQRETLYSVRLYALHELGHMLHQHGFRVTEVSGMEATRGVFFGADSPRIVILAERPAGEGS
ncbi:MAG: methyltransferase domain-containing protein [Myxococcota bacterium]|nr:methyltransferase domain-containing protein [Myxococcota bacterium]MDW8361511.1 methyltransferase domain-containing protein [Myxococcales bacterium]